MPTFKRPKGPAEDRLLTTPWHSASTVGKVCSTPQSLIKLDEATLGTKAIRQVRSTASPPASEGPKSEVDDGAESCDSQANGEAITSRFGALERWPSTGNTNVARPGLSGPAEVFLAITGMIDLQVRVLERQISTKSRMCLTRMELAKQGVDWLDENDWKAPCNRRCSHESGEEITRAAGRPSKRGGHVPRPAVGYRRSSSPGEPTDISIYPSNA